MVTARRQEWLQHPGVGRSSSAIPRTRVMADIYYLWPCSPKYLLATPQGRDVKACVGFQKPCSPGSPGTGDEQGRGHGAGAATGGSASSPRAGQGWTQPHKTLNCHIWPWPAAPCFGTAMKQPCPSAGRVLSREGTPRPAQPPEVPDPAGAAFTNLAPTAEPRRHQQTWGLLSSRGSVRGHLRSWVKSNLSTE